MKNYILGIFSIAVIALSLQSCKEEIQLAGDFQETAVVYGLIDQSDSIHMIKITRAFIGPGNSLEIATNPDSNYFQSVQGTVTERVGGIVGRTWTLFDTIILNKDENGIFYAPEQKLYSFYTHGMDNSDSPTGEALLDNATYTLDLDINNGDFTVTGETEIVSGVYTSHDQTTTHFQFAEGAGITGEFKTTGLTVYPNNAKIVETILVAEYEEFIGGNSIGFKSFEWNLGNREINLGGNETFTMNGQSFYENMALSCSSSDPLVDKRNFTSLTVKVVGGSDELNNYIIVNQPSSSIAQSKPSYTNLSTSDEDHQVVGIFSSRYTHKKRLMFIDVSQFVRCIDRNTTHELCQGAITGQYNFCSNHTLDIAGGYSFACQ